MPRAGIREERLRVTSGLRSADAITSWRGASGAMGAAAGNTLALDWTGRISTSEAAGRWCWGAGAGTAVS